MYIKVRVTTHAKLEEIREKDETHFEVSVKERPERNLANARIIELIASRFALPSNKVRIVSGHHSPSKILSLDLDKL